MMAKPTYFQVRIAKVLERAEADGPEEAVERSVGLEQ
jgi:hypothetical protein